MKFLFFAILFVGALLLSPIASGFDFDSLKTTHGRMYHEIRILSSDDHGLLFRHRDGIAKENFQVLSRGVREMFEPVAEIPDINIDPAMQHEENAATEEVDESSDELLITLRIRQTYPLSPCLRSADRTCGLHPHPGNWPSHWHRFHPAHYLTNPVCRARQIRHFLQSTGLQPIPCGSPMTAYAAPGPIRFQ